MKGAGLVFGVVLVLVMLVVLLGPYISSVTSIGDAQTGGASAFVKVLPYFLVFAVLGIIGTLVWKFWSK